MRLLSVLLSRKPQVESKVPFQEILPLSLKNKVSGKSDSQEEVSCLQEMSILFACMKTNEFNESLCSKEINTFRKCYKTSLDKKKAAKTAQIQGTGIVPGSNLNYKQVNKLLNQFSNPK